MHKKRDGKHDRNENKPIQKQKEEIVTNRRRKR
jgi:hypothetical protein